LRRGLVGWAGFSLCAGLASCVGGASSPLALKCLPQPLVTRGLSRFDAPARPGPGQGPPAELAPVVPRVFYRISARPLIPRCPSAQVESHRPSVWPGSGPRRVIIGATRMTSANRTWLSAQHGQPPSCPPRAHGMNSTERRRGQADRDPLPGRYGGAPAEEKVAICCSGRRIQPGRATALAPASYQDGGLLEIGQVDLAVSGSLPRRLPGSLVAHASLFRRLPRVCRPRSVEGRSAHAPGSPSRRLRPGTPEERNLRLATRYIAADGGVVDGFSSALSPAPRGDWSTFALVSLPVYASPHVPILVAGLLRGRACAVPSGDLRQLP